MYTSMKTISLDHPVRVYFKDGECYHDSATIMIANGFPSLVRARGPDVIYPWENVKHVIRVADEPTEADIIKRMRASVAAIADERNGAKQDAMRLGTLLVSVVEKVSAAFGCRNQDPQDPATAVDLAERVKLLRSENARLNTLHTEHRIALRAALGLRDDESADNVTGDFKALCERVRALKHMHDAARDGLDKSAAHHVERLAQLRLDLSQALGVDDTELGHEDLCKRSAYLKRTHDAACRDLASVTEQRDVLKRQLEELRAEMRRPTKPDGTVLFPTLEQQAAAFRENNPSDAEHQQVQNRDKWRATCLANGAKDCTVYFGPGDEVTFVVELQPCLRPAKVLDGMQQALLEEHGLRVNDYKLREVRPLVDGVKTSHFQL